MIREIIKYKKRAKPIKIITIGPGSVSALTMNFSGSKFKFPILETGSLIKNKKPMVEVIKIRILSTCVNGFLFSLGVLSFGETSFSTNWSVPLITSIVSTSLTGLAPILPNNGPANQNCKHPKSIKIPAKPKP